MENDKNMSVTLSQITCAQKSIKELTSKVQRLKAKLEADIKKANYELATKISNDIFSNPSQYNWNCMYAEEKIQLQCHIPSLEESTKTKSYTVINGITVELINGWCHLYGADLVSFINTNKLEIDYRLNKYITAADNDISYYSDRVHRSYLFKNKLQHFMLGVSK
jgi:hypothetical protein